MRASCRGGAAELARPALYGTRGDISGHCVRAGQALGPYSMGVYGWQVDFLADLQCAGWWKEMITLTLEWYGEILRRDTRRWRASDRGAARSGGNVRVVQGGGVQADEAAWDGNFGVSLQDLLK